MSNNPDKPPLSREKLELRLNEYVGRKRKSNTKTIEIMKVVRSAAKAKGYLVNFEGDDVKLEEY